MSILLPATSVLVRTCMVVPKDKRELVFHFSVTSLDGDVREDQFAFRHEVLPCGEDEELSFTLFVEQAPKDAVRVEVLCRVSFAHGREAYQNYQKARFRHELNQRSLNRRVHWGGVERAFRDTFNTHPIFLLLAASEPSAIKFASDLLGVDEALLAFFLAILTLAPASALGPLLSADLQAAEHVYSCCKMKKGFFEEPSHEQVPTEHGLSRPLKPLDTESVSSDSCGECVGSDPFLARVRSVECAMDAADPFSFQDELMNLYSVDESFSFTAMKERTGHDLWPYWRTSGDVGHSTVFENVAIDSLKEMLAGEKWQGMPCNMHLLFSVMLVELHALLLTSSDLSKAMAKAPSVSLMLSLAHLHQARVRCASRKRPMSRRSAEFHLLPAMWGVEVHLQQENLKAGRCYVKLSLSF